MTEDLRKIGSTAGIASFEYTYERPHCIVLDSAYSSMGRMIAAKACAKAGYTYYDSVLLLELVPECGVTQEEVNAFDQKLRTGERSAEEMRADPEYCRLAEAFSKAADKALAAGPCLFHDRIAKEEILAKGYTCLSGITYSLNDYEKVIRARVSPRYKDMQDDAEVLKGVHEEDMVRANWHRGGSDTVWGNLETYDFAMNTDAFGRDYAIEIFARIMGA